MTGVVVDTSAYVSALVFGGVPRTAIERAMQQPYSLATSNAIRAELVETLFTKFGWPQDRIEDAAATLWSEAQWYEPLAVLASRDPNDNHVLGCALAARAEIIITGDKDLLVLHPFNSIAVLTPAQFINLPEPT